MYTRWLPFHNIFSDPSEDVVDSAELYVGKSVSFCSTWIAYECTGSTAYKYIELYKKRLLDTVTKERMFLKLPKLYPSDVKRIRHYEDSLRFEWDVLSPHPTHIIGLLISKTNHNVNIHGENIEFRHKYYKNVRLRKRM